MNQGWTPAHCAAESGHIRVLKILAEYSADLFACDENGDTPQRCAELYGHVSSVKFPGEEYFLLTWTQPPAIKFKKKKHCRLSHFP